MQMSLAKRIKEERIKNGLSQAELALKVNTKQQIIHKLESGLIKNPRNIRNIAEALKTSPEYLLFGKRENITYNLNLPVIEWADALTFIGNNQNIKKINLPENYFCLILQDDSMLNSMADSPTFPKGTLIFVKPVNIAKPGDYVIAKHKNLENSGPIFRKLTTDYVYTMLISLNVNPMYKPYGIEEFDIIGVVVASMNVDL